MDFGPEPLEAPLSEEQADELQDGTRVVVTWSGGNGPHRYVVVRDADDTPVYVVPEHEDVHGPFRYYNPLSFVGKERFHTRVWLDL